jgi:hypothetical protein
METWKLEQSVFGITGARAAQRQRSGQLPPYNTVALAVSQSDCIRLDSLVVVAEPRQASSSRTW